nr:MAG TPA: hypothetical protein [Caudoviricetes sp.]
MGRRRNQTMARLTPHKVTTPPALRLPGCGECH